MKKLFILLLVLCFSITLVLAVNALSYNLKRGINQQFLGCKRQCLQEKRIDYTNCNNQYKENIANCRINYESCIGGADRKGDRNILRATLKNCTEVYNKCRKLQSNLKEGCVRDFTGEYNGCKKNCTDKKVNCIESYEPVCSADGKTYPNECILKIAKVEKAYDGKCMPNCGDQICDEEAETWYNCPEDCKDGHICEDYTYGTCPSFCRQTCIPSCFICADCSGPGSCMGNERRIGCNWRPTRGADGCYNIFGHRRTNWGCWSCDAFLGYYYNGTQCIGVSGCAIYDDLVLFSSSEECHELCEK